MSENGPENTNRCHYGLDCVRHAAPYSDPCALSGVRLRARMDVSERVGGRASAEAAAEQGQPPEGMGLFIALEQSVLTSIPRHQRGTRRTVIARHWGLIART
jgi:hypothetical protein